MEKEEKRSVEETAKKVIDSYGFSTTAHGFYNKIVRIFCEGAEHGAKLKEEECASQSPHPERQREMELPSDEELLAFSKEWASVFEGKERLGMESAHYAGQLRLRDKIKFQLSSHPVPEIAK